MNLSLTSDQVLIRDAAETFLADASTSAAVRRAMETAEGFDFAVWHRIATELGWCGLTVPEAFGGLGLSAVELALVQEQAGRHLLCSPFFATVVLGATLVDAVGTDAARERFGAEIAEGRIRCAVPLPSGDLSEAAGSVFARRDGADWILDGHIARMPDGTTADWLLVPALAAGEGAASLFAVRRQADGVALESLPTWDATRRLARVRLTGVRVAAADRLDDPARAADGFARATALARLALAAEQLGGAQACLDLTVAYTATRKQFGRAIAGFQAVKHRCAEMMVKIEALRSAIAGVSALAATQPPTATLVAECAAVKASASDTYFFCAQEAVQLHGGVGFTWEYDPQLHFKRAQAGSHALGASSDLWARVAQALPEDAAASAPESATDDPFRRRVADWMQAHLAGRFAPLKHRGGPGDEEFEPELRKEWERELAIGGWTCVGWPKADGGQGLSIEQQVVFHEEYARAGGPGRMGHIGEGLIGPTLIAFGTDAQKQRFLPGIVEGRTFWAQGYSEPNAGSDLANVQTRCWQEADGSWRVQGQKIWTSLAHESEWIFVLARSEPGSKGSKGLTFLLLPLAQKGIEIRPIRQMGGGSEFNEVFFDGAIAQAGDVVGQPGDGWKVAMGLLEAERGVSTLGQQMRFTHELERVLAAARARGRFADPAIRARIAQAWAGLRTMRYNALRTLSGGDGLSLAKPALIFKYYWSNWHRDLGKLAMDVLGPDGDVMSDEADVRPLQQLFFFSRADTIYAGTNEIQLNLIAERGLGMPREPRPIP